MQEEFLNKQQTRLPVTKILLEDRQVSKQTTGGGKPKEKCRQMLYYS